MDKIFKYHDGEKEVFGDPYAILRELISGCDGDLAGVVDKWKSPNMQLRVPAINQLLAVARKVFGLAPWVAARGEGVLDQQVQDILESFFEFSAQKKTTHEPSPTEQPVTDLVAAC